MGATCCKDPLNPNKVHIKKINEIFVNCKIESAFSVRVDLKNKGIDTSKKDYSKGSDLLD
jgi:hypothetical protein